MAKNHDDELNELPSDDMKTDNAVMKSQKQQQQDKANELIHAIRYKLTNSFTDSDQKGQSHASNDLLLIEISNLTW